MQSNKHLWFFYNKPLENIQGLSGMVTIESDLGLFVQGKILDNGGVRGDKRINQNKECQ